ncbi:MAG: hypothetical protein J4215_01540 [Candidatus Diapherotrites archaeon]|uniref:Uncharacterized protein n=1 Tax=Candidatus Iainarchaeum sp. TaxID=3101447 RepID=A0A8T4L3V1_9ARCH|nr:hypothetical protein [Candidatus Diapherotrites archaeon]
MKKPFSLAELNAEVKQLESRSKVAEKHLHAWFLSRVKRLKKHIASLRKQKAKKLAKSQKKKPVRKKRLVKVR